MANVKNNVAMQAALGYTIRLTFR